MKNLNKKNQLDTSKSKTNLTYTEEQIELAVQYAIGDDITQTLSSGVKIKGEVQKYQLDSDSAGSRYLFLAHVGADDGEFREFVNGISLNKTSPSGSIGLKVTGLEEINNISETEQNEIFTLPAVDDFLDFSEDNPFGDPDNQLCSVDITIMKELESPFRYSVGFLITYM